MGKLLIELNESILSIKLALSCMHKNSLKVGGLYDCIVTDPCISKDNNGNDMLPKMVKVEIIDKKYIGYLLCTTNFYRQGARVSNCRMLTNRYTFFVDCKESEKALKNLVGFSRSFIIVLGVVILLLVMLCLMIHTCYIKS